MIYSIFKYLTDVPFNFWFWLLIITAPALVFIAKPQSPYWLRLWRLIFAIGATYVLINLSLHTSRTLDRKDYYECQNNSIHRHMSPEMYEECKHHINIADGASNIFYALLGWIPATAYVGIFELIWRMKNRKKIKELDKNYKGKWFSNITISFTIFFFVIFPAIGIISALIASAT